jgi:dihydrolipoamide dehydrogenase
MSEDSFDVVVIGGGPGGSVCAIRAAQLGLKTACVEMRDTLGGTCLNVGCIPSKALLTSSEKFEEANHSFAMHGVKLGSVSLDLDAMMAHKDKVVEENTTGIGFLFKKNKVTWLKGRGKVAGPGSVSISDGPDAGKTVSAKHIVIATGSESMPLPGLVVDEKRVVTSTGAIALSKVPKHLVVVGAGVIGLEMGSVWKRLGAEVTVIEYLDRVTPGMDGEISKTFKRILEKQGIVFRMKSKVTGATKSKTGVTLTVEPAEGGAAEEVKADVVLVAIGRRPYVEGLGLDEVGVKRNARGFIEIDEHFQTSVPGIYAVGDCVPGAMLAHKAEDEGVVLAEILAGQSGHINYDLIPNIVYTWPEVASVGRTEEQLKEAGIPYRSGKFPFSANGRARAMGSTDGFVKILAHKETDRILGCHIIGPDAGTLIHEIVAVMEFGGSAEDVARTSHGHPTLAEVVKEAALAVDGRPIHM